MKNDKGSPVVNLKEALEWLKQYEGTRVKAL
jgi:hypothetical protein